MTHDEKDQGKGFPERSASPSGKVRRGGNRMKVIYVIGSPFGCVQKERPLWAIMHDRECKLCASKETIQPPKIPIQGGEKGG
jgi:hypothetical protein